MDIETTEDEPQHRSPFWNFNVGHLSVLLALLSMTGAAWLFLADIKTAIVANHVLIEAHEVRIARLENDGSIVRLTQQLSDLSREVSVLTGEIRMMLPERRGEFAAPQPHDGGG